ncbi:Pkinase-domain-containing protein [Pluteus cervinus]|uniref:Pkinase-domain-containing protein n=1 Tax=Pluteus cervinus TaxID=181527 RepID=A0ACD3B275_9AGAR|nr:Pkinase-domain-containing protein [Pluteus cervinus]
MSAGTSGGKITGGPGKPQPESTPTSPVVSTRNGKPASVHSDSGSHKFNLKDLLANGPKLARRSSQKSASSRKSDSDFEGPAGVAKSTAGDSATSLSKKYGVCQKVAIGKGATSVVRLAHKWDRTEEKLYAVKEFRKRRKNETEKQYIKKLTAEFCISSTLHHPNIVETVDLVQDEGQHWCEVMEFCPGGDLYAAIKKGGMSESEVECCFKQILNGVGYLHSQGVAHRDIKPENLFFDTKGQLKIGDYGASTVYRLPWEATIHMSTGLCGSEPYIAPEQFLGKPYDARLVDIWACGVVYYCLHFQELPWRAAQPQTDTLYAAYATACANSNTSISACPPTINNLSPRACRPLIRKMLEPDPNHRACIEDCLAHSWIKSIEVCHDVPNPHHVHSSARALAHSQLRDIERVRSVSFNYLGDRN